MQDASRPPESSGFREEVAAGIRFRFGRNWSRFLGVIDGVRIEEAARSLREMLDHQRLDGLSFLDVGCGSGLFSLAARQLGARVFSFDYDPECVDCARRLRRGHRGDDAEWSIEEASVLDADFMASARSVRRRLRVGEPSPTPGSSEGPWSSRRTGSSPAA